MGFNITGKNGVILPFKENKFIANHSMIIQDISNIMFIEKNYIHFVEDLIEYEETLVSMYISETKLYISFKDQNHYYVFPKIEEEVIKNIEKTNTVIINMLEEKNKECEIKYYISYNNVITL